MKIFLPSDTVFTSNGERSVRPISCYEHRETGDWFVSCEFTLDDLDVIKQDFILLVPTKEMGEQPFRIHDIDVENIITCRADHVGFDTKHYVVKLSTIVDGNCHECLAELLSNVTRSTPFSIGSDITTRKSFSVENVSMYSALLTIADEYNAVLDFDGWQIVMLSSIGVDKGITISEGKNLKTASLSEDWSLVVTKLTPIGNEGIKLDPEDLVADVSYDKPYDKIMQFDTDSLENLALVAQLYLDRYKVPKVNYRVEVSMRPDDLHLDGIDPASHEALALLTHAQLASMTHDQLANLTLVQFEQLIQSAYFNLGDTIQVKARQFEAMTDVISYDYNVLSQYVTTIEFGNYRPTVKNYFNDLKGEIEEASVKRVQVKIDETNAELNISIAGVRDDYGETVANVKKNFAFNLQGFRIGSSSNDFQMNVDETELGFYEGSTPMAAFGNSEFKIDRGRVLSSLIVGVHKIEKYSSGITIVRYIGE